MNILPKKYRDFQNKDYWDQFYDQTKNKLHDAHFEWYGEYSSYKPILNAQVPKEARKILNVGCGKSLFSEEMYKDGFKNIENIDYSEKTIKEMQMRSADKFPGMTYSVGDLYKMDKFETGQYDVIMDKGTLDAVHSHDNLKELQKLGEEIDSSIFKSYERILKESGVYCVISLLQDHVAHLLLSSWVTKRGFDAKVFPVSLKGSKMNPFLVILKKSKGKEGVIEIFGPDGKQLKAKSDDVGKALAEIKSSQLQDVVMRDIPNIKPGERRSMNIYGANQTPKYTVHVIDHPDKQVSKKVRKTIGELRI